MKGRESSKEKEKRLLEKIVEYLKSDSYMYASLIDVGSISPAPPGNVCPFFEKRKTFSSALHEYCFEDFILIHGEFLL